VVHGRTPPSPPGIPVLNNGREFRHDLIQAFVKNWREYGDVVRFVLPGGKLSFYLLAHPDHIQYVLEDNQPNFPKDPKTMANFRPYIGDGLFVSQGDFYVRQRRVAEPAFQRDRIAAFAPMMIETTQAMLDRWSGVAERGQVLDITTEILSLTLTIVMKTLFSADVRAKADTIAEAVRGCTSWVHGRLESRINLPETWPLPVNRRFEQNRAVLDDFVYGLIAERRRSEQDSGDLLSKYMATRDELTGEYMNDKQLRDEVTTIFLGGYETTAIAIIWTFYVLSRYPEIERRVRDELNAAVGDRPATYDDLPNLPYLRMVVMESMRLYPPVWTISRAAIEDDVIGDYHIPAGSVVFLSQYVTHRHPEFWDNPEGFDPERFTKERMAERHKYAYFPFSGGLRRCVGFSLAMMEAPLVIALVLQAYRLNLVPDYRADPRPRIFLFPRHGMPMMVERINGSRPSSATKS
jgi:cytochrome P450